MTPKQALELLDQMVASMRLSRPEHFQAVQAIQVLSSLIPQPEPQRTDLRSVEQPK